jgi:hypothetical protein
LAVVSTRPGSLLWDLMPKFIAIPINFRPLLVSLG